MLDLDADMRESRVEGLRALLKCGGLEAVVNPVADLGGMKYDRHRMKMNSSVLNTHPPPLALQTLQTGVGQCFGCPSSMFGLVQRRARMLSPVGELGQGWR